MNLRPMNDVAFQFVFGKNERKYNLINLLNAILSKDINAPIEDLTLLETELTPELIGLKGCRLDVRALTSEDHHINIEVQILNKRNIEKRSLYYWSKLFTAQLEKGQDYRELSKTISINILDFSYFSNEKVHNVFHILEKETFERLTDVLEIHFLELNKIRQISVNPDDSLMRWLRFLGSKDILRLREEIFMKDKEIKRDYADLEKLAADKNARRLYELREKATRDWISSHNSAREEGIKEGLKVGHEEKARQIAQRLLSKGLDLDLISETTGLSKEELGEI